MVDPSDERLPDDDTDAEIEAFERELRKAANEHKIDLDELAVEAEPYVEPKLELGSTIAESQAAESAAEAEAKLSELDMKLSEIRESHRMEADDIPEVKSELDMRLDGVEARARAARATKSARLANETKRHESERTAATGLGVGLSVAYTIIGVPVAFFFLGTYIDYLNHTSQWKGIFGGIGSILGLAAGIWQLNRMQNRL